MVSKRLNDWIRDRVMDIHYFIDDDAPETYNELKRRFVEIGAIPVSDKFCDNTMFGDPVINVMFRVWHDHHHIKGDFDFTQDGEIKTAFAQIAELPEDWWKEKFMILCDIVGQGSYFCTHNDFPVNQNEFLHGLITTGKI